MALIAYARTSSTDQKNSIQTQVDRFKTLGVDEDLIFVEQRSGKSAEDRPKLQEMLRTIRKGDMGGDNQGENSASIRMRERRWGRDEGRA